MRVIQTFFSQFSGVRLSQSRLYIDLGSANTRIVFNGELVFSEPTCVALHEPSGSVVAVGSRALSLLGKTPESVVLAFPMQGGTLANSLQLEKFLQVVLDSVVRLPLLQSLVFGHTAFVAVSDLLFPSKQVLLRQALKNSGVSAAHIVPLSQALAYSPELLSSQNTAVCCIDLGAEKTQVSIASLGETIYSESFLWGGARITELLQEYVRTRYGCVVSWRTAEEVKIQLSAVKQPKHKVAFKGKDLLTQASKTVVVHAGEVMEAFSLYIGELLDHLQQIFAVLPSQSAVSALESGLFLTGSTSLLSDLDVRIAERFLCPVTISQQPNLDCVLGLYKRNTHI